MRRLALFFALAGMLLARRAHAQIDPWEFEVYPVQTLGKGEEDRQPSHRGVSESSRGCRLRAELLRDPAHELRTLAVAETRIGMQHPVVPGGHVAARD